MHWPLPQLLAQGSGNSGDFLGDRSVFCSKEVSLSELPDDSWRGAGHWKNQALIRSLEFSAILPKSLEEEGGLEMEFTVNHVSIKIPKV